MICLVLLHHLVHLITLVFQVSVLFISSVIVCPTLMCFTWLYLPLPGSHVYCFPSLSLSICCSDSDDLTCQFSSRSPSSCSPTGLS